MLKIIVLIPLILSVLWFGYLKANNYSVADGKQGFKYILVISSVIAVFFTFMYFENSRSQDLTNNANRLFNQRDENGIALL